MSVAHDLIIDQIDQLSPAGDGEKHLATWYTQGHSDGLGDRLLMFDNTSAPSWEILRFKPALAHDDRFEGALRERMEQLASFHHQAFPLVRPLKGLGHEDGLAVVSTYAPGVHLSEAMKRPRSAAFTVRLLRQLAPAVASLQQHGSGIFHGALDADRIVVAPGGQLTIREHMVGSALANLDLSAARLWSDFHILTPPSAPTTPGLDRRTDVVQLGLVALSLMAGHRIGPDEYPAKVEGLLDVIAERNGREALVFFQSLRYWLERALQLDEYMFESARDANDALAELRDEPEYPQDFPDSGGSTLPVMPERPGALDDGKASPRGRPRPQLVATSRMNAIEDTPLPASAAVESGAGVAEFSGQTSHEPVSSPRRRIGGAVHWIAIVVAAAAVAEALFIGRLLYAGAAIPPPVPSAVVIESPQPGASVWVDDRAAGVTPLQLQLGPRVRSIRVLPAAVAPDPKGPEGPTTTEPKGTAPKVGTTVSGATAGPIASQRNGGFRLSSPIEVYVLDNERVLGSSTDGPIVAAAGRHEFEIVNSTIGYRVRRVVDIKAGQITSLSVAVPNGTLNINAVPWAAVWIDGNSFGDTPLGNLSIPPGEHEIVFRHPQLGERHEKTIVRADGATRVTMNLQR